MNAIHHGQPVDHQVSPTLMDLVLPNGLRPLLLAGRKLLPVVQGGMGVGVWAHRLAGSVAAEGCVGTIASVDLRHHHPDLLERTASLPVAHESKAIIDAANLEALSREIRMARERSKGLGLLAVNVMRVVNEYAASVRKALECRIDAIVVGAGLPLDLPELATDHANVLLIPILSDVRGIQLVVKNGSARADCRALLSLSIRAMPVAISVPHGSPTFMTRASTSKTSFLRRWHSFVTWALSHRCR